MLASNKNKIKRLQKKQNKSTEGKLVLLNEEQLIQQVCMRPVIYDRSLKGYRKTSLRKQCWNDISKAMESTEEECRKRWRSLRDSFAKHYKGAQKAGDTNPNKHCKWVFYDQMSFLIPHLDGVSYDLDKILDELGDMSEDAKSLNSEPNILNSASEELVSNENIMETVKEIQEQSVEQRDNKQQTSVSVQATDFMTNSIENLNQSSMNNNDNNNISTTSTSLPKHHHSCSNNITSSTSPIFCPVYNGDHNRVLFDSDEKFLLSCAPALRRLTHRQNALARLKIQQVLFDIEFDQKND